MPGTDDAWRTRIPQGWIQFPDGSIGPPNSVGSDWNAPYRTPAPPAPPPAGPLSVPNSQPAPLAPAVDSSPSPLGTSLTTAEPQIFPPNNSTIPNNKSVGPFTGGTSTEGDYWDPHNWFKGGQTFNAGEPIGGGPSFNPLTMLGGGNPYWRGAIAGAGVLSPTPAETGEFNPGMFPPRPDAPKTGGLPAPATQSGSGYGDPRLWGNPPSSNKSTPPKRINPKSVNLGTGTPGVTAPVQAPSNSPFIGIDRPNASATGWNPGTRMGTALDLSSLFSHPAVAAAAAAHPAVHAAIAARPDLAQRVPLDQTPMPPRRPKQRVADSSTSQGGGYS
jgi:hypothetical protein